jgi:beta-phosphoglucomutase-like phosphatase (HAD superfamily)
VLAKLGITDWIDIIADGYSVDAPKPAPDLFLYAADRLGLAPAECVVFEDATAGITAALAAGSRVVGLGPIERVGDAHLVLPHFIEVRWQDVVAQLASSHLTK